MAKPLSTWDQVNRHQMLYHLFTYWVVSEKLDDVFADEPLSYSPQMTVDGQTRLHRHTKRWGAGYTSHYVFQYWSSMMKQAVKGGALLTAIDDERCTPLMVFLTQWSIEDIGAAFHCWVERLTQAGVELQDYGKAEQRCWRHWQKKTEHHCSGPSESILRFKYGSAPSDWTLWPRYPSDECAGIFWDLLDRQRWSVPGAWEERHELRLLDKDQNWMRREFHRGLKRELKRLEAQGSDVGTFRRTPSIVLDGETKIITIEVGCYMRAKDSDRNLGRMVTVLQQALHQSPLSARR